MKQNMWNGDSIVIRKARKDHTCYQCKRTILKAERYEDCSYYFFEGSCSDYDFGHFRTCMHCVRINRKAEEVERREELRIQRSCEHDYLLQEDGSWVCKKCLKLENNLT